MCPPMEHNKQACDEESGDVDFDYLKTAPWDAGGTKRDEIHEARCRPMVHNVDRWTTGNTKCELTTKRLIDTNCPRLESTRVKTTLVTEVQTGPQKDIRPVRLSPCLV